MLNVNRDNLAMSDDLGEVAKQTLGQMLDAWRNQHWATCTSCKTKRGNPHGLKCQAFALEVRKMLQEYEQAVVDVNVKEESEMTKEFDEFAGRKVRFHDGRLGTIVLRLSTTSAKQFRVRMKRIGYAPPHEYRNVTAGDFEFITFQEFKRGE